MCNIIRLQFLNLPSSLSSHELLLVKIISQIIFSHNYWLIIISQIPIQRKATYI